MEIKQLNTGPFGVNTWIVPLCGNKVIVFDPAACEFTLDSEKITGFLLNNNLSPVCIILTHGHFDHIMGTRVLKNAFPELPLICHKNDLSMCGASAFETQGQALEMMGLSYLAGALKELPEPDIFFENEVALSALVKTEDEELRNALAEWKVICTPGHTPGSVCWYNKAQKILISGDTVFYHSWGRTDLPGGSEADIRKSLSRLYSLIPDEVLVFPGHDYAGFCIGENK